MNWLEQLVTSGGVAFLGLLFIVVEVLLIAFVLRDPGKLKHVALTLASGFLLICAVGAALLQSSSLLIALFLIAAMIAHIADMSIRLGNSDALRRTDFSSAPDVRRD